ncbi:hypothetical protein ACWGID_39020 [Kribbella sp. NPDC054772]
MGVSGRVVEQRVRNRVIEVLEILADGDGGVLLVGVGDYFNLFFDWVDEPPRALSTYTAEEFEQVGRVLAVVNEALAATEGLEQVDEIIESGWPTRIAVVAREAFAVMAARGRFSEDAEEAEPSYT